MNLTERHIINPNHHIYDNIDNMCFLSKNLYNAVLFYIKQHYLETGKVLRFNEIDKYFRESKQHDYHQLPNNTSQQIMMVLDRNIKSYFALLKKWKKDNKSLNGCPKFPKYKHKTKGRNLLVFTSNQFKIKNGNQIFFPKKSGIPPIITKIKDTSSIKQVRIVPQNSCYVVEVVYEVQEKEFVNNENKASIDLGVNNLATVTFNNSKDSLIINGKPLKSNNQFYNKQKAKLQSDLEKRHNKKSSNRLNRLHNNRNNKINDYIHKSSRKVVDYLISNNISEVVVGYNKEWKQNLNLGSRTNQNFSSIPYNKFIEQLVYKCKLVGINVIKREESYTSKCSAIDNEPLCKKEVYYGRRVKRGMYKTKDGIKLNADVNGSLNIGRKVFGDGFVEKYRTDRGYGYYPVKVTL